MIIHRMSIPLARALAAAATALCIAGPTRAWGEEASPATPPAAPAAAPTPRAKTIEDFGTVTALPFRENTTVLGKVDTDLSGVWLLLANAEVAAGKFKTFPQILRVEKGPDGPHFHLLDVRLPAAMAAQVKDSSLRTLTKWQPSAEQLQSLAASWASLEPAKEKTLDEFLYDKVEYVLAAPDSYAQAFPKRDAVLSKVLENSRWSLTVDETYRPRDLPADARIAQLIERKTIYAAQDASPERIRGGLVLGFVAAGAGTPLPFNFGGDFVLYRLAAAAN